MKARFLLITLSILSLSIGCIEEEDSECYTQMMLYLETGEQSYKDQIARILRTMFETKRACPGFFR
jgi:hypothetical protein